MHPVSPNRVSLALAAALVAVPLASAAANPHDQIQGTFPDGPSVTAKCLECHPQAASQVMSTTHWTWSSPQELGGKTVDLGKRTRSTTTASP
ncbi:MAG: hypothetical protein HY900_24740 [Deltaproteobacteria bacterium]|nr:hypothetical protein [Deltaproteobacteria bacterium]